MSETEKTVAVDFQDLPIDARFQFDGDFYVKRDQSSATRGGHQVISFDDFDIVTVKVITPVVDQVEPFDNGPTLSALVLYLDAWRNHEKSIRELDVARKRLIERLVKADCLDDLRSAIR